ncbi:MAG: EF-hand domain-containing protein [Pseudomonadota bacterium]
MKAIIVSIATGGLLVLAQQAVACPGGQHGAGAPCPVGGGMTQLMDKNGDGVVSRKEFDAYHAERFQELDTNKDGKLSADELTPMHPPMHGMLRGGMQMSFEQHFDAADTNHDGFLSREEAKDGMPILFDRFDENDANKDGKISKDEIMSDPRPPRGQGMMRGNP